MKRNVKLSILSVLLLSSVLNGCTSKSPATSPTPAVSAAATKSTGPVTIETSINGWGVKIPEDDFLKKTLDEKLGLNLKVSSGANQEDYKAQMNVRAASNSLPDLMYLDKIQYQEFAKNGLLLDLAPYLDKLKDVKSVLGEENFKKSVVNGKQLGFTLKPNLFVEAYWIRKDWLDKLGLKQPTTPDEFFNVAKAFTENDPDGNGKKDTYGITGDASTVFNGVFTLFGTVNSATAGGPSVPLPGGFYLRDGKLINSLYDPNTKQALAYIQKLIAANVVDPDATSAKTADAMNKVYQGKAGIIYNNWGLVRGDNLTKIKAANPNAEWVLIENLRSPLGGQAGIVDAGAASQYVALPATLAKSPEKLDAIFKLLSYTSKGEGSNLVQFGVKARHYTQDGDKITLTDKATETSYSWIYQFVGRPEQQYLSTKFPASADWIKKSVELPRITILNGFIDLPEGFQAADVRRYIEEEFLKFEYGKSNLNDYDKFIQTLEKTFKYTLLVDQANKQLKENGILK
ncbi:extracellular solute-binding protein [Paenibacillus sp. HWE-109]|uniref:extracellular solute-binding protein n=1 Tax=Paenibacillus sp. HWE-109 TaxID=1306526 RepID=UPI001EE0349D|nr:extracellular solute-binding protein [Paenibacillus sp. HWE-109]UKS26906.1 extracellular solute-binding protein [Paenibacillus sp. HWE-109]